MGLFAVENQGYGSVIDQFDLHHGPKSARLGRNPMSLDGIDKGLVKRNGGFRWSSIDKAGTPALAAIAIERELADDQDRASDLRHVPIHFSFIVIENAKGDD